MKTDDNSGDRRLTTWKEIGAFFGRDERTVKRWETLRGLPVRRVPGGARGSVFAYESELGAWLHGVPADEVGVGQPEPAEIPPGSSDAAQSAAIENGAGATPEAPEAAPTVRGRLGLIILAAGMGILCIAAIIVGWPLSPGRTGLTPAAPILPGSHRPDAATAALYRSGLHSWQTRTPAGLKRAVEDFDQAIARDPDYAEAYAGLSDCYNLLREFTMMPPEEAYPKAKAAATRAVELDPSLAGAHASLAFVDFYWSRDAAGARREFETALALEPGSAVAHHWYATFLMTLGDFDSALAQIAKAEELDPESGAILADKGLMLFYAGQQQQAIGLLTRLEDEGPAFVSPHRYLALIFWAVGRDENYLAESRLSAQLLKDENGLKIAEAGLSGFRAGGHAGMLHAMLDQQRKLFEAGSVSAYAVADTFAALDDKADALAYLQISVSRHESDAIALKIDPAFEPWRGDPTLKALAAQAGLPESS